MTKQYTSKDIQVLTDREHVRKRTQVYLGNMSETIYSIPIFNIKGNIFKIEEISFIPAAYKAVGEIIDNCIDEFAQINNKNKTLRIDAHPEVGEYTITDNGRGIPIDKHETGNYTPEVALSSLRSGRNFEDELTKGVIGQNGVGSACTNYCSEYFNVDIHRDGKRYRQKYFNGAETSTKPSIRKGSEKKTGTSIEFKLDGTIFSNVSLPNVLIENRAIEIALTNPGITTEYNGKSFKFKKGFHDVVKNISNNYFRFELDGDEFFVIFDVYEGIDEKIFSWVNSSLLFDGGICNTQFLNAFCDKVISQLEREAKKNKCVVTKNDIRQNLLILGNLRISNPEYDAQSKTRLTGPQRRKEMDQLLDNGWSSFNRKNKDWLNEVLQRAIVRHHSSANKKALKDHKKNLSKKVPGLVDATSKDRSETKLFVTEGLSAASQIIQVRNPKIHGSYPLTGKINNVYGSSISQLLKMGKITDLLTALGLVPGQKAIRDDLNFGKLIIATDADVDGGSIFNLLINLFYQFWPELFDPDQTPFIHRIVTPNIIASKGNKKKYFTTREEFDKVSPKYKNWNVTYIKGLGSLSKEDYEELLMDDQYLLPVVDDGNIKNILNLLFSDNVDARKKWLQGGS